MIAQAQPIEVRVEVGPWLTRTFGHRGGGWLAFGSTVPSGATIGDLLGKLAQEHPGFAPYAQSASNSLGYRYLCLALNGRVVAGAAELGHELQGGDVLAMLVALAGD